MSINDISSQGPHDTDLADAFRTAKRRVDSRLPAVKELTAQVAELGEKSEAAISLQPGECVRVQP